MNAKGIVELHRQNFGERQYWYILKAPNGKTLVTSETIKRYVDVENVIAKYFPFPEWKFKDKTGD